MMQCASQKFRVLSLLYLLNILILYHVTVLRMAAGSPAVDSGSPPSCNQTCDYVEIGQDAYCNGRNLTEVPQYCSQSVFLDMRGNALQELHRGDFLHFTSLMYLDLSQNSLEKINSGTFAGASQLLDIYMFKNRLCNVHHDAFSDAENIRSIYLSRNDIQALPHTALRGLPRLEVFFMSHNKLCYINRHQFIHNRELTHLGFAYNQLELILPETFRHLSKLEYLDLSYNNIHYIQGNAFGNLQNLETLKMANNSLESEFITYDLLSHPKLEIIDLSSNMIDTIPPDLDQSALGKLRLAENPLSCDCSLLDLQAFYKAKLDAALGDPEDWMWVEEAKCSNGSLLIDTTIECDTTTSLIPTAAKQGDSYIPYEIDAQAAHSSFLTPVVISAIVVSFICGIICIYVIVCWVKACLKEHQYRKHSSSSVSSIVGKKAGAEPV